MEHADYLMQHALQGLECHDLLASLTKGAGLAIRLLPTAHVPVVCFIGLHSYVLSHAQSWQSDAQSCSLVVTSSTVMCRVCRWQRGWCSASIWPAYRAGSPNATALHEGPAAAGAAAAQLS